MSAAAPEFSPSVTEPQAGKRIAAYRGVTGLLGLALFASGMGALTRQDFLVEAMTGLGFPLYVMRILGTAYVLAAVSLVVPGVPRLKEWASAGVVFAMAGAIASHAFSGDTFADYVGALTIMSLALTSYVLRPSDLRLVARPADGSV